MPAGLVDILTAHATLCTLRSKRGFIVKQLQRLLLFILTTLLAVNIATAADFTPAQQQSIEKIVRDYLVKNPEVLVEVSHALQEKQQAQILKHAESAIPSHANQLFNNAYSPVVGNNNAKVTLVEFFDYQCVHCRQMAPVINNLLQKDKNLRVVYKEFPIFGPSSEMASRAALAAIQQGKYKTFHHALMQAQPPMTKEKVINVAKDVGLDIKKLENDMQSKAVSTELENNHKLAQVLGVMGTPAFIVAGNPYQSKNKPFFVPGQVSENVLQNIINEAAQQQ